MRKEKIGAIVKKWFIRAEVDEHASKKKEEGARDGRKWKLRKRESEEKKKKKKKIKYNVHWWLSVHQHKPSRILRE